MGAKAAFSAAILLTALLLPGPGNTAKPTAVPLSGTYRRADSSLVVRTMPGGKRIRFALSLLASGAKTGDAPNTGDAGGEAALQGGYTAVYRKDRCTITMRFAPHKATLTQRGDAADCDFGSGVDATGTYRRDNDAKQ